MSFLISVVFGDVVQIVTSDNNGPLHLGGDDNALKDLSPNGNIASERTLLIDIFGLDGLLGSLEAETDILEVSNSG